MTYKMFIDDERFPPGDESKWIIVRSSEEAINTVKTLGMPEFVSYDHDLGGDDTSIKFIWWMINSHMDGEFSNFPTMYEVHSQNPIGSKNIKYLLDGYIKSLQSNT
jgi:hypothetical protein